MNLTEEQTFICSAVATGESVMVEALAGCAKSIWDRCLPEPNSGPSESLASCTMLVLQQFRQ